jgi:hypothetical protein
MNGEAIVSVSAAVVALTQLAKWAGLDDSKGPLAVLVCSVLGVAFWAWSSGDATRATAFGYFAGCIAVMTSAAGVYGFTRATGDTLTKMRSGPVVLLALALGGLLASGCGGRVPPALTSANPTDAQVQEVRRDAAEIAGAVKAGIAIVDEARTFANVTPLPQPAKDAINCSILKATGTTEPPAPVVISVCGTLPNGPGPLYHALDELASVSSTPSLRTTVAALMRALDPIFAALQNSSNQALAGFAAALRGTFAYASGFLGGVQ